MKHLLSIAAFTAVISALSGSAIADPTIPGTPEVNATPRAPVDKGPVPIRRMSSVEDTANFTCDTTEKNLLAKRIILPRPGTVSVHLSAEGFAGCRALTRLTLNGVEVPGPGDAASPMLLQDAGDQPASVGFNWVVTNVPAGASIIRAKCRCLSGSSLFDERTMIIYHE